MLAAILTNGDVIPLHIKSGLRALPGLKELPATPLAADDLDPLNVMVLAHRVRLHADLNLQAASYSPHDGPVLELIALGTLLAHDLHRRAATNDLDSHVIQYFHDRVAYRAFQNFAGFAHRQSSFKGLGWSRPTLPLNYDQQQFRFNRHWACICHAATLLGGFRELSYGLVCPARTASLEICGAPMTPKTSPAPHAPQDAHETQESAAIEACRGPKAGGY
jgi:hypothetical protein